MAAVEPLASRAPKKRTKACEPATLGSAVAAASDDQGAARAPAPADIEAACREIELLLGLQELDLAHLRITTALQKFSGQNRLTELQSTVEKELLRHHNGQALRAIDAGNRRQAVYHHETSAALETVPRRKWAALDRAREVSPHFELMLSEIDGEKPRSRIYIMGCGRSGTYLLTGLMECFRDIYVLPDEVPAGRFARVRAPEQTHVLKRDAVAPLMIEFLPPSIHVLFIVRFPLDVLVSSYGDTQYYMPTRVWSRHTVALRRLLTVGRPNLKVVRYEDLVREPDQAQARIAQHYRLQPLRPFSEFDQGFTASEPIAEAMNGIRPPDAASIGRWRTEARHIDYCRTIWPEIREDALWLCRAFDYEVPAELEAQQPSGSTARKPAKMSERERGIIRATRLDAKQQIEQPTLWPSPLPSGTLPMRAGPASYKALEHELPLLRFKAERYDALEPTVPALRYKAGRYDELEPELVGLRYKADRHDELEGQIAALRGKADRYDELAAEMLALRGKAERYDAIMSELPVLRHKAARYDELEAELPDLRHRAARGDELAAEIPALRQRAERLFALETELPALRDRAERYDAAMAELSVARHRAAQYDVLAGELPGLRHRAARGDELAAEMPALRQEADRCAELEAELLALRGKAERYDAVMAEVPVLRHKAERWDRLETALPGLRRKVARGDELAAEIPGLRQKADRCAALEAELPGLRRKADRCDELEAELPALRQKSRRYDSLDPLMRYKSGKFDEFRPQLPTLRYKARRYDELKELLPVWRSKAERYDRIIANRLAKFALPLLEARPARARDRRHRS
jgi:hypothetical protein